MNTNANMDNETRIALERRIVRELIEGLAARGFVPFRVYDSREFIYPHTLDATLEAVFAVDESSLRFVPKAAHVRYVEAAQLVASEVPGGLSSGAVTDARRRAKEAARNAEHGVLLIGGNGVDVISDWGYSTDDTDGFNAAMEAVTTTIWQSVEGD